MSAMTVRQVRRRYLILHALRWLPTGLLIPVTILLMQERGLSLAQIGWAAAAQGLIVLALELPTGGLADALGSRPVLLVAAVINLASLALFVVADTFALLAVVWALQGVFRALDSGPLESWYVNATLAADPEAEFEGGLSAGGTVLGVAIGAGALLSGGLVALGPIGPFGPIGPLERIGPVSALTLPILVAAVLQVLSLFALALLLVEVRAAAPARPAQGALRTSPTGVAALRASLTAAPSMIADAFRLLRRSRILLALVAVELFWGFGMTTFEALLPIRLSEVVGTADRAATLLGPAGSVAWLASAAGAALAPVLARRIGAAPAAALLRVAQGVTVVGMALLAGPVGVLLAYLACYSVHGASNPLHMGLLHRQVDGPYRTSVLSLNSMVAQPAGAAGGVTLTALAGATSVSVAMLVGAAVLAVAAPLYLPAWLAARRGRATGVTVSGPSPASEPTVSDPPRASEPAPATGVGASDLVRPGAKPDA